MTTLGPNAQKRYYQQASPQASTTHLLSPNSASSSHNYSPVNSSPATPGAQSVQAALSQTPRSVRNMASDVSLVRIGSPLSSHL